MAGAGYKLFTTGSVLTAAEVNTYLQEQTIMVFANAAARTTALASVLSEGMVSYLKDTDVVEIYTGAAWVSLDDPNAIQNSIVDAKGDLITATANDTPARLAVGSNGDSLVADSSATTGLRWQGNQTAGKNAIINGGFDIWQRGTSFSPNASIIYTADRWCAYRNGGGTGETVTRQAGTTGFQYAARVARDSGNTATNLINFATSLESNDSYRFAGQTITISFYARCGANYSAASSVLNMICDTGTGTDQNILSGLTGSSRIINQTATLTTSWQRFSFSGSVASTATQVTMAFYYTPVGTAGANDWFEVTGVQLELGSVATSFARAGGTIQGELAACQRYYEKSYAQATAPGTAFTAGNSTFGGTGATANITQSIFYKVTKRAGATLTVYDAAGTSGKVSYYDGSWKNAGSVVAGYSFEAGGWLQTAIASSTFISFMYTAEAEL